MTDPLKFAMDSLMGDLNVDASFRRILSGPHEPPTVPKYRPQDVAAALKTILRENAHTSVLLWGHTINEAAATILSLEATVKRLESEQKAIELLRAIVAAYDKSLTYENTTIPSILMATIEAARRVA